MPDLRHTAKSILLSLLRPAGLTVTRLETLDDLHRKLQTLEFELSQLRAKELVRAFPSDHQHRLLDLLPNSHSQIGQDLFVLSELDFRRNGFFVEFGAADGITGSNTHLLERSFAWNGILAEPARIWHNALKSNRCAKISTKCVWRTSNATLPFNEARLAGLSTLEPYTEGDAWAAARVTNTKYSVETVSLIDLLSEFSAPAEIDYLSIDTEGSEYDILNAFDFSKYRFTIITCEHNYTPARELIHTLLSKQGYIRKFQELSRFDDWYVHSEAAPRRA